MTEPLSTTLKMTGGGIEDRGPEEVERPLTPEEAIRDYPEKLAKALLDREASRRAKWRAQRGTST